MKRRSINRFSIMIVLLLSIGLLTIITTNAQSSATIQVEQEISPPPSNSENWKAAELVLRNLNNRSSVNIPLPPNKDPCLHCHITGENKGLWTPLARWILVGSMGMFLTFGIYRSASVWVTKTPWKPIRARTVDWVDERYNISKPLQKVLSKPVPKFALRWWYCLGGVTLVLFALQGITGIMLAFYYRPTPEAAFTSIQFIESQVRFGSAIRAVHHWAANGMIIMCIAHMLRVFIMGAFKPPRELNWISGMLLLLLTLAFGFTGYLLPWDQRAYWATTVGTEIAGSIPVIGDLALIFLRVGWAVTGQTLSRFYALHILALPILTLLFMGAHFLMVRRQGLAKPL